MRTTVGKRPVGAPTEWLTIGDKKKKEKIWWWRRMKELKLENFLKNRHRFVRFQTQTDQPKPFWIPPCESTTQWRGLWSLTGVVNQRRKVKVTGLLKSYWVFQTARWRESSNKKVVQLVLSEMSEGLIWTFRGWNFRLQMLLCASRPIVS